MSENLQPWQMVPLGTLASEMCLGKMLDKERNQGTLRPYLRNVNVRWFTFDLDDLKEMRFEEREEGRYDLRAGDLVICEGGEPGRTAVWKGQAEAAKIQKALHRVRFFADTYDPTFAMYFMYYGTITNQFAAFYTGTTIKHLTGESLRQIEFPLPPLNEQRRIVAKIEELFSELDAGVAALQRVRANLKRYRASVLQAAVTGKLTEAWRAKHRDVEPASELLRRILAERRRKWEQEQLAKFAAASKTPPKGWQSKYVEPTAPDTTGLPEVPAGWCWASVEQLCENFDGVRIPVKAKDRQERQGQFPYYGASGVIDYVDAYLFDGTYLLIAEDGANLLSRSTPIAFQASGKFWVNNHAHVVLPLDGIVMSYVQHYFNATRFDFVITGTAQPKLTQAALNRITLPLPSTAEQMAIAEEVDRRLSILDEIEAQVERDLLRAARLRQSILKRAFEGKLVPQDPSDEPADKLLDRIRQQRDASSNGSARRTRTKAKPSSELTE